MPEQVQKAQSVTWGSSSEAHSPHFCYATFALPSCTCDHGGLPCYGGELTGEDSGKLVYEWFYTICRHHLKVDSCCPHPVFGTSLKDIGEGKSSLGRELEPVILTERETLEKRNGQTHRVIKDLKKSWLANWSQRKAGKRDVGSLLWIVERHEDICVLCECFSKGDLSRGGFWLSSR